MFRHYDIGNVEALGGRLARSRATIARLTKAETGGRAESTPEQHVAG